MFKYNFGDKVEISRSNESGLVVGRAEYLDAQNQYWVKYVAADGRAVDDWFKEDDINLV